MLPTYLIALGNPGKEYAETRHNAGDLVVARLKLLATLGGESDMFAEGADHGVSVHKLVRADQVVAVVLAPQEYMNRSGESLFAWQRYHTGPPLVTGNMLIIRDDLDMPLGDIRLQQTAGSGGHHGVESIQQQFGKELLWQLKVGIGRPAGPTPIDAYVLQKFSGAEQLLAQQAIDKAANLLFTIYVTDAAPLAPVTIHAEQTDN